MLTLSGQAHCMPSKRTSCRPSAYPLKKMMVFDDKMAMLPARLPPSPAHKRKGDASNTSAGTPYSGTKATWASNASMRRSSICNTQLT